MIPPKIFHECHDYITLNEHFLLHSEYCSITLQFNKVINLEKLKEQRDKCIVYIKNKFQLISSHLQILLFPSFQFFSENDCISPNNRKIFQAQQHNSGCSLIVLCALNICICIYVYIYLRVFIQIGKL